MSFAVPCHPPRRGHGIREYAERERKGRFLSLKTVLLCRAKEGGGADFGGSVGLIRENLSRLRHSASV